MKNVIKTSADISEYIAEKFTSLIADKPDSVVAVESSELLENVYFEIIKQSKNKNLDYSKVTFIIVNEFAGNSSISRLTYLKKILLNELNLNEENLLVPNENNLTSLDERIQSLGGIDFTLLQVKDNGAVGFNEPATPFDSYTHIQLLTDSTKDFYRTITNFDDIPENGYTLGIKSLFLSKNVILTAVGEDKAEIVHKVVYGKTVPYVPASMFQMHVSVDLCIDSAAASKL